MILIEKIAKKKKLESTRVNMLNLRSLSWDQDKLIKNK